jgi:hypothetical protein
MYIAQRKLIRSLWIRPRLSWIRPLVVWTSQMQEAETAAAAEAAAEAAAAAASAAAAAATAVAAALLHCWTSAKPSPTPPMRRGARPHSSTKTFAF